MTERDDYLVDPTLPPEPEIEALERALQPLRWRDAPLREQPPGGAPPPATPASPSSRSSRSSPRRSRAFAWAIAAAAALLAAIGYLAWAPRDELQPGMSARTFVAEQGAVAIRLGALAEVTLRPGSELRFEHWQPQQALLTLRRGGLSARVVPTVPAEFFVVDTPLGRVVDQGCRYDLDLDADGTARVRVTEGAVTFAAAAGDRVVWVPVGASVRVTSRGPLTPCFDDASDELKKTLHEFEAVSAKTDDPAERVGAFERVRAAARAPGDTLVLWHALTDREPKLAYLAEEQLRDLVGPPRPNEKQERFPPEEWLPFLRLHAWPADKRK